MPVAPIRNNGQEQSLTVLLRNIISEYPAGGGVLRELCQNADDAGADAIEFVLDTRQHPKENLLHKDLEKFQGISLLAYNNKRFSQNDFESLMRIGDSGKAKDLTSTGKFGRGFNSVITTPLMAFARHSTTLLISGLLGIQLDRQSIHTLRNVTPIA